MKNITHAGPTPSGLYNAISYLANKVEDVKYLLWVPIFLVIFLCGNSQALIL